MIQPDDWGCPPPSRPQTPLTLPKLALVHHWIDDTDIDENYDNAQRARNIVDFHMNSNGWSWGAYSAMMGVDCDVFLLHGLKTNSFSEGTPNRADPGWWSDAFGPHLPQAGQSWNPLCVSLLWMVGADFAPTDEMIDTAQQLVCYVRDNVQEWGPIVNVRHGDLRAKSCPGPAVGELVDAGVFGPTGADPAYPWPDSPLYS